MRGWVAEYKHMLIFSVVLPQSLGQGAAFSGGNQAAALGEETDGAQIFGSQAEALAFLLDAMKINQELAGVYPVAFLIREKQPFLIMFFHLFADILVFGSQVDPVEIPGSFDFGYFFYDRLIRSLLGMIRQGIVNVIRAADQYAECALWVRQEALLPVGNVLTDMGIENAVGPG